MRVELFAAGVVRVGVRLDDHRTLLAPIGRVPHLLAHSGLLGLVVYGAGSHGGGVRLHGVVVLTLVSDRLNLVKLVTAFVFAIASGSG